MLKRVSLNLFCNTSNEVLHENIRANLALELPVVATTPAHDGHAVLCGSGASLNKSIADIKQRQVLGQKIFALNNAAKYLHDHGILADYQVILDPREENKQFIVQGIPKLLASQCHPELVYDNQDEVTLWHPVIDGIESIIQVPYTLVGGGLTVGLSAMALAYVLGYRTIHLYGYDSSYTDGRLRCSKQFKSKDHKIIAMVDGKKFTTNQTMAKQAENFIEFQKELSKDCLITVHGEGLLPYIAKRIYYNNL
jgi:hypothetical protein